VLDRNERVFQQLDCLQCPLSRYPPGECPPWLVLGLKDRPVPAYASDFSRKFEGAPFPLTRRVCRAGREGEGLKDVVLEMMAVT